MLEEEFVQDNTDCQKNKKRNTWQCQIWGATAARADLRGGLFLQATAQAHGKLTRSVRRPCLARTVWSAPSTRDLFSGLYFLKTIVHHNMYVRWQKYKQKKFSQDICRVKNFRSKKLRNTKIPQYRCPPHGRTSKITGGVFFQRGRTHNLVRPCFRAKSHNIKILKPEVQAH